MSLIDEKSKNASHPPVTAGAERLPPDGPHRFIKKQVNSEKEKAEAPSYVVAIVKKSPEEEVATVSPKYDPKEMREKAKTYLESGKISSDDKKVLRHILEPDKDPRA